MINYTVLSIGELPENQHLFPLKFPLLWQKKALKQTNLGRTRELQYQVNREMASYVSMHMFDQANIYGTDYYSTGTTRSLG